MQLDSFNDGSSAPRVRLIVVVRDGGVGAGIEGRSKRSCNASLERIAGNVLHLHFYFFQTLSLALSDLDREKLKQVSIVIGRSCSRSFRAVEQSTSDVESD